MKLILKKLYFLSFIFITQACFNINDNDGHRKKKEKLVIITPHQSDIINEFGRKFKEYYKNKTGNTVETEFLDLGGTSNDLKYILSEFTGNPGGIGVDIFWGGGVVPFDILKRKGLLESYKPDKKILSHIPEKIGEVLVYDPEYKWFGSALSTFGIICNKNLLKINRLSQPLTWKDLSVPGYRGLIGAVDPRNSGTSHTMFSMILQAYGWQKGWEIIYGIGRNTKRFANGSSDITRGIASGEITCGLTIDFFAWLSIFELGEKNISFIIPRDGAVINADGIAILKGTKKKETAHEFVSYVLSEKGQSLWMLPAGHTEGPELKTLARMPVIPMLYDKHKNDSVLKLNPFKITGTFNYNEERLGITWQLLNDMIGTLVIDKKVHSGKVPVDKNTAMKYSEKWDNQLFRNKVLNGWLKL
ncbi:MAG: extracellular solute-binding protein [Oligoflexia bacterium]|nr:extracellular solute-binding protein [Oligoflexia bacterium]